MKKERILGRERESETKKQKQKEEVKEMEKYKEKEEQKHNERVREKEEEKENIRERKREWVQIKKKRSNQSQSEKYLLVFPFFITPTGRYQQLINEESNCIIAYYIPTRIQYIT